MPTLGLDMEGAVIQKWLKAEGDSVDKDEPVVVVETDKATTEIVAPTTGVLKQIVQPEGATVPVTQTIALIETSEPGESEEEPEIGSNGYGRSSTAPTEPSTALAAAPTPARPGPTGGKVRASPAARKVAKDLGVDLSRVEGTGPGGRIQGDDVRRFAAAARPRPATEPVAPSTGVVTAEGSLPGRLVPLGRKRRLTAERMSLSARTVARLTMNMEVDATEMIRLRDRLLPVYEVRTGTRLSYNDILVKVVATALADHPYLNARWTEQGILLVEPINVGVAVAVEDGLVVPVVRGAGRKRLEEVSAELSRLVARAREDRLSLEEITGGTFTITNLGMFGVESFTPIVNPPETAILGVGAMVEKPAGRDGQIVLRPMMTLSLSFDHRIVDGAPAAQFLQRVKQLLEEPYLLL
jgi:pyruvate dehydrogenase E2 component (dihydrolipoamide acetyltransferase)